MSNDYIPDSFENRQKWFANLKAGVVANAATLKLSAADLAAFNTLIDPLIAGYQAVVDAQKALDTASGDAQDLFDVSNAPLRAFINDVKTNANFTDGIGAALQIFSDTSKPQPGDIKPALTVAPARGHVRITGSKNYAETVNLYMRRAGGSWTLIAPKRKRFPFDDQTPLAAVGIPEVREYMAHGVIGDDEVGQDSDIVSCTYAG